MECVPAACAARRSIPRDDIEKNDTMIFREFRDAIDILGTNCDQNLNLTRR